MDCTAYCNPEGNFCPLASEVGIGSAKMSSLCQKEEDRRNEREGKAKEEGGIQLDQGLGFQLEFSSHTCQETYWGLDFAVTVSSGKSGSFCASSRAAK